MSDSLAPSGIVTNLTDIGARCGNAVGKRRTPVRFSVIAVSLQTKFVCNVAMAQVSGMAGPTPTIGATSPLGIGAGSSVSQTGIPLGSTEIASPGISPSPTGVTGTIAMPGSGTTCSTLGTSPSSMFGSTASFDGGGMGVGTAAPATAATSGSSTSSGMSATSGVSTTSGMLDTSGSSGMCGSGSSSVTSSSTPTSPTVPGDGARTGIPVGSTEIGNLGVSSAAAVPTIGVLPTVGTAPLVPTMPTISSPSTVSSTTTSTVGNTPGINPSGSTLAPTGP